MSRSERRLRAIGANRDFRRLWIGQLGSDLGSSMTVLTIPLLAVAVTGSAGEAGLLGSLSALTTWLTAVPAGHLADRFGPRALMLGCDAVRLAAMALLGAGALLGRPPFWLLAVVVVVVNGAMTAFNPALGKMLRTVVPADQLPEAVSANQVRGYATSVGGPALGGALFAVRHALPFAADAASYLVSLATVRRLPAGRGAAPAPDRRRWPDLGEGLRVVRRTPFLRSTLGYSVFANTAVSMLLFVLMLRPGAGGGPAGVSLSAAALAGLLGSLAAPAVYRRFGLRRILLLVTAARLLAVAAAALIGGPVALGAALAAVLLLGPVAGAAIGTATLLAVDYEVYGRASGTTSFIGSALQPVGPLLAGLLVQAAGVGRSLGVVAGLFALCLGAVAVGRRGLDVRVLAEPPPPPARSARPRTAGA